jgi:hypothetical protein
VMALSLLFEPTPWLGRGSGAADTGFPGVRRGCGMQLGALTWLRVQAALTFLAVFPMVWLPCLAPLVFGLVASACFLVTSLKYPLHRLRSI